MRFRVISIGTALLLGCLSLPGVVWLTGSAAAATPNPVTGRPEQPVQSLKKADAQLRPVPDGRQRSASAANSQNFGAVTFVDDIAEQPTIQFQLSGPDDQQFDIQLAAGTYSAPQFVPAGTYRLSEQPADPGGGFQTFIVTASQDTSEVLYPLVPGVAPEWGLASFTDHVRTVPVGRSVVSFRNLAQRVGPLDYYVNYREVAAAVPVGATADVDVPVGIDQITVVAAGKPPSDFLLQGPAVVTADVYLPLYSTVDTNPPHAVVVANDTPFIQGYQFVAADGGVFNFGGFPFEGSEGGVHLNKPIVGGAEDPTGNGYYLVASDGGVFSEGGARFAGSLGSLRLNAPIIGMAVTAGANGRTPGYLLLASDGGVFAFNTPFLGSAVAQVHGSRSSAVGIVTDPATGSYDIALANGQVESYATDGDVSDIGPGPVNQPIVGIAMAPAGQSVWLFSATGQIYPAGGNALYFGSATNIRLNQPIVGLFPSYDGFGYTLIARDGGVFTYGDARYYGSTGAIHLNQPIVASINLTD